jgi:hypothetical protein
MADQGTTGIPILTYWAIIGPLLVAMVSALWNKKNNLDERSYQRKLSIENQHKAREIENKQSQLHMQRERLLITKVAILNFLRLSHTNFHSNIRFTTCPNDNSDEKNKLLNEQMLKSQEMINSYNELYLLMPTMDVAKASTMLLKHLSENRTTFLDKESVDEMTKTYAKLREGLLIAARKYTQEEEQHIINICAL